MNNPDHGKVITIQSFYGGELASTKREQIVSLFTTKETILKDVIDALSLITRSETKKLELEVCVDQHGRYRLIKRWVI